jgi:hypothetical protein
MRRRAGAARAARVVGTLNDENERDAVDDERDVHRRRCRRAFVSTSPQEIDELPLSPHETMTMTKRCEQHCYHRRRWRWYHDGRRRCVIVAVVIMVRVVVVQELVPCCIAMAQLADVACVRVALFRRLLNV